MVDERSDNDAGVSDGMADAMGGSTLAFMSMTVLVMVALLAILLLFALKVQEADLSKTKEAQLTQRIEQLEQELASARAAARAAAANAGGSGRYVSAGLEMWEDAQESVNYLTPATPKHDYDRPLTIKFICRPPGYWDPKTLEWNPDGQLRSKGVVPR